MDVDVDDVPPRRVRTLLRMGARLCLADDAAVVSWRANDSAIPPVVCSAQ